MRRFHLIEFHEQRWVPAHWRKLFQLGLGLAQSKARPYDSLREKLIDLLEETDTYTLLDLCSGSADIAVYLLELFKDSDRYDDLELHLSDLFPMTEHYERLQSRYPETIRFFSEPVDVRRPPQMGPHIRTIVASLHHFKPPDVRGIFEDAARNSTGIVVLENSSRSLGSILQCALVPLASLIVTAFFLRPWRPSHLLWGLLIPVLPFISTWDALVSNLRAYTVEELRDMTDSISISGFEWEVGTRPIPGMPAYVTYVIGKRTTTPDS